MNHRSSNAANAITGAGWISVLAQAGAAPAHPRRALRPISPAPRERAHLLRATAEAQVALREAASAAAEAAERAHAIATALDEALAVLKEAECTSLATAAPPASRQSAALSPREREVLALVAEGRTNKAIAEALYVSPNTVKTHVGSLLNKLHADTRVQLATIAARQGPIH